MTPDQPKNTTEHALSLLLPPGYRMVGAGPINVGHAPPPMPGQPTGHGWLRHVFRPWEYPGDNAGEKRLRGWGRGPREADVSALDSAWEDYLSREPGSIPDQTILVDVLDKGTVSANTIRAIERPGGLGSVSEPAGITGLPLPAGYELGKPTHHTDRGKWSVSVYRTGNPVPVDTGVGETMTQAQGAAFALAWKHDKNNPRTTPAAAEPDTRLTESGWLVTGSESHDGKPRVGDLARSLPPGFRFERGTPHRSGFEWADTVCYPESEGYPGGGKLVGYGSTPLAAAKDAQQAAWRHYRETLPKSPALPGETKPEAPGWTDPPGALPPGWRYVTTPRPTGTGGQTGYTRAAEAPRPAGARRVAVRGFGRSPQEASAQVTYAAWQRYEYDREEAAKKADAAQESLQAAQEAAKPAQAGSGQPEAPEAGKRDPGANAGTSDNVRQTMNPVERAQALRSALTEIVRGMPDGGGGPFRPEAPPVVALPGNKAGILRLLPNQYITLHTDGMVTVGKSGEDPQAEGGAPLVWNGAAVTPGPGESWFPTVHAVEWRRV